jgi:hypothetical protein
LRAEVFIYKVD